MALLYAELNRATIDPRIDHIYMIVAGLSLFGLLTHEMYTCKAEKKKALFWFGINCIINLTIIGVTGYFLWAGAKSGDTSEFDQPQFLMMMLLPAVISFLIFSFAKTCLVIHDYVGAAKTSLSLVCFVVGFLLLFQIKYFAQEDLPNPLMHGYQSAANEPPKELSGWAKTEDAPPIESRPISVPQHHRVH